VALLGDASALDGQEELEKTEFVQESFGAVIGRIVEMATRRDDADPPASAEAAVPR
jgi:hypothetical protein